MIYCYKIAKNFSTAAKLPIRREFLYPFPKGCDWMNYVLETTNMEQTTLEEAIQGRATMLVFVRHLG
jgi:hypothetical protein